MSHSIVKFSLKEGVMKVNQVFPEAKEGVHGDQEQGV